MASREAALGLNALALVNVANAWQPFSRRGQASFASFLAAWPTSELPMPALGLHLAMMTALGARGAFRGRTGIANGVITGAVGAGLVGLHKVARDADAVFETALVV